MPKTKLTTVNQYIEAAPQEAQEKLLPKGLIRKIAAYRARQVKEMICVGCVSMNDGLITKT